MIDSKPRLINEEDEEMDDELEMATVLLIGKYLEEGANESYMPYWFSYWS
jgi:hypothetical protein